MPVRGHASKKEFQQFFNEKNEKEYKTMKQEFENEIGNALEEFVTRKERAELLNTVKKLRLFADKLEQMAWGSDCSDLEKIHAWNICTNALVKQMEMTPEEREEQRKRKDEWEAAILQEKKKAALREEELQ